MADRSMWRTAFLGYRDPCDDERNGLVEALTDKTTEISSALRCRLSEVEAPSAIDPDAQNRHLILIGLAQNVELDVQSVRRRRLFRRAR
jgi:hypothetical protein